MEKWDKDHEKAAFIRKLASRPGRNYDSYRAYIETKGPDNAANVMICLIHQTSYLLDRLLLELEKAFLEDGGITENLYKARSEATARRKE
jgi:four helix bundle suffix protein